MHTTSLSALLSCSDLHSLKVLNEALRKRRIHGHICESDPVEALERRKVDLFVLDLDQDNNEWFRDFSHVDTYSNGIVVIAISQSPQTLRDKGGKHVQCTLLKPLNIGLAAKAIDDACAILERERRPACRFDVNFPVSAALLGKNSERPLSRVVLKNISYTGACVSSAQILPIGELVSVHFDIPDTGRPFQAIGSVIWSDSQGQCGIQFQYVSPEHISALREWLKIKMGKTNAGSPASQTLPIASPVATWEH